MDQTPALTHVYCDMDEWIKNEHNLAFEEGGDYGVFEFEYSGVYTGHYFFKSRGKEARARAIKMLRHVFDQYATLIRGLTPTHHKGALWMNRQLGFKPYGIVETEAGDHQIFIQTRDEFNTRFNA